MVLYTTPSTRLEAQGLGGFRRLRRLNFANVAMRAAWLRLVRTQLPLGTIADLIVIVLFVVFATVCMWCLRPILYSAERELCAN